MEQTESTTAATTPLGALVHVTEDDLRWWNAIAPTLNWKWARTYANEAPHWYLLRQTCGLSESDYHRACLVIWTFGHPGKYHHLTKVYLTASPLEPGEEPRPVPGNATPGTVMKWFTSPKPRDYPTLQERLINAMINMAPAALVYGEQNAPDTRPCHGDGPITRFYDEVAMSYDDRYDTPECREENRAVRSILRDHFGAYAFSMLDVGAGTGLMLDLQVTAAAMTTALDPSQAMLNELVVKHPTVARVIPATLEQALDPDLGPGRCSLISAEHNYAYEAVVSTFGSPSYISPEAIRALAFRATRLIVLMHYADDYLPPYHDGQYPPHYESSRQAARDLLEASGNGYSTRIGNYETTVIATPPRGRERRLDLTSAPRIDGMFP